MPLRWLQAHAEAMPELQGQECFRDAEVVSVGAGKLKKSDHDRVLRRWGSEMGRGKARGLDPARLASFGITVRHEPR